MRSDRPRHASGLMFDPLLYLELHQSETHPKTLLANQGLAENNAFYNT